MKEILAIIRPDKMPCTKEALSQAGFPGYTGRSVNGRGEEPLTYEMPDHTFRKSGMIPKRALILEVEDDEVDQVVEVLTKANCTGNQGDGKIFVMPIRASYTVSSMTKE